MSNLFVLRVNDEQTAQQILAKLKELQDQQLITIDDAAIVTMTPDGKPKVKQAQNLVGAGALGGAFWGMLIGLLFFVPFFGAAIGAATGAISAKFADIGINDDFIKKVGSAMQPGQMALFLMTHGAVTDKVLPELKQFQMEIIETSLSATDETKLRETLGVGATAQ